MPTFNLGALNATTEPVPVGNGISVNVSGTFVGTVQIQRATQPGATFTPMAADNLGALLQFTGPSGDLMIQALPGEADALIRATVTAYTSGTAVTRVGK